VNKQYSTADVTALLQSFEELNQRFKKLEVEVIALRKENKELKLENKQLKERIAELEHKKDSTNSSMSPSSDIIKTKKTKSLREPSGKKVGGQVGHKGHTLKMVENPDEIKEYFPNHCKHCGNDLSEVSAKLLGNRQVLDIPPIFPIVTEHRVYTKQCSCGFCTKSEYPETVKSPMSYGPNLQAFTAYFSARQYIPVKRLQEIFSDVLNLNISTGGICFLLDKMAKKAEHRYEDIKTAVLNEKVIGADETGANINGNNHWFWTYQNPFYTFIDINKGRGFAAIEETIGNKFENLCLVTDCWPAYFKTNAASHQLCLAHLQRELQFFAQKYPKQTWAMRFNLLLYNAYKLYQKYSSIPKELRDKILDEHLSLLNTKPIQAGKDLMAFYRRMKKYKDHLFNFLFDPDIPPDNNASERAIRNVKVKQKVSGLFKSFKGAKNYAIFRSCIDTAIKQGQKPLDVLNSIALS
jgi:transposase